jgi:hypothetical protein
MALLLREDGDEGTCMMAQCTHSDFLPTKCMNCNRKFCSHHISPQSHGCTNYAKKDARTVECPLCNQAVAVRPGQSPDAAVGAHIETGCTPSGAQAAAGQRLNMCSFGTCTRNEIQQIVCDYCRQTYCVEHRHPKQHSCRAKPTTPPPEANRQSPSAASSSASPGPEGASKKPRTSGYAKIASLTALNTAATAYSLVPGKPNGIGDGHVVAEFFAYVALRVGDKPKSLRPAFFSLPPTASLGRVLDGVATKLDFPNENNVARDDEDKLWLFLLPTANAGMAVEPLCLPPSLSVRDCVESMAGGVTSVPRVFIARGMRPPAELMAELAAASGQPTQSPPAASGGAASAANNNRGSPAKSSKKEEGCVAC